MDKSGLITMSNEVLFPEIVGIIENIVLKC